MSSVATIVPNINSATRHDWSRDEITALLNAPLNDLLFSAHNTHRQHFNPNEVQLSTLLNIKSGGCPEDCAYCPQSSKFDTGVEASKLLDVETVRQAATKAKANGATRFCMGAAWRSPKDRDIEKVAALIGVVKDLEMESCVTLGMLDESQAKRLRDAGLDYYNHNLDTSEEYYSEIITTRTYQDRLDTLSVVRDAGINVCCGGIIGMGEDEKDRAGLIQALANLPKHPESVPINLLVQVEGTALNGITPIEPLEMIRMIATTRITMPSSYVRLSAGRETMSDEAQALCFFAGANSIFYGEELLTTSNPVADADKALFGKLGISPASN
ncbi:MAG: biotin synthase BioB [Gammaproteobacteria bacterium]